MISFIAIRGFFLVWNFVAMLSRSTITFFLPFSPFTDWLDLVDTFNLQSSLSLVITKLPRHGFAFLCVDRNLDHFRLMLFFYLTLLVRFIMTRLALDWSGVCVGDLLAFLLFHFLAFVNLYLSRGFVASPFGCSNAFKVVWIRFWFIIQNILVVWATLIPMYLL